MIRCYFLGGSVDLGGSVVNIYNLRSFTQLLARIHRKRRNKPSEKGLHLSGMDLANDLQQFCNFQCW